MQIYILYWRFRNSEPYKNTGHEKGPPEIVPSVGGGFQKSTTDSLSTYSTIQGGSLLVKIQTINSQKITKKSLLLTCVLVRTKTNLIWTIRN